MDAATPRTTLVINDAAARGGVSRRTMYYWIKIGRVETKRVGGSLRVYVDTIPSRQRQPPLKTAFSREDAEGLLR